MSSKEYQAAWHQANKERRKPGIKARKDAVKERNRTYLAELKNVPCRDCGKTYPPYVMDFDHLADKTCNLSDNRVLFWSIAKIDEEANKCEVVCANCHRQRTWERLMLL